MKMKPKYLLILSVAISIWIVSPILEARLAINDESLGIGADLGALGMKSMFKFDSVIGDISYRNPSSVGLLMNGVEVSLVGLPFARDLIDRKGAFLVALNPQKLGLLNRRVGNISLASRFDGWGEDRRRNRILSFGYGYAFGRAVVAGGKIRYHRRRENTNTYLGWSYDLGFQFSRKLTRFGDQIAFALSVDRLGGLLRSNGRLVQNLPAVVRFGTAIYLDSATAFSGDLALYNEDQLNSKNRFRVNLVAEKWLFNRQFGLRLGYKTVANDGRFIDGEWSRGFSLCNGATRVDYAYVSGGNSDEGLHWIAVTLGWDGTLNAESRSPAQQPLPILMPDLPPYAPGTAKPISQLSETAIEFRVSESTISPNRDGVKDSTKFAFTIPPGMAWQLRICDELGELMQHNSGNGLSPEFPIWNGRNDEGDLVNDGVYIARFTGFDSLGKSHFHRQEVIRVDTSPANLKIQAEPLLLKSASEESVRPNLNGLLATNVPTFHVQASDSDHISTWDLKILERGGDVIDRLEGNGTPPNTIVWNKWSDHKWFARSDMNYDCVMTAYDTAGNRSTRNVPLPVVELLSNELPVLEEALRQEELVAEAVALSEPDLAPRSKESSVVFTLPGIFFDFGTFEVNPEFQSALGQVAGAILAHPEARVTIEGHTDSEGEADYNLQLSYQRSEAVKDYLVGKFGIPPERLETFGYGEGRSVVDNDVESNRQKNRRVEILLSSVANPSVMNTTTEVVDFEVLPTKVMPLSDSGNPVSVEAEVIPMWTLLLGSFKYRENAELFVENLGMLNIADDIQLSEAIMGDNTWYRVTVGHFYERADSVELSDRFMESQGIDALLISAN